MNKVFLSVIAMAILAFISACAPAPTPTPTSLPPTAVPTSRPPTAPPSLPTLPPLPPTAAPPTAVPPTAAPAVPPAPTVPPGLYVVNLRLEPERPAYNQSVAFFATFANATDRTQNFRWRVYIYRGDTPWRTNSETTFTDTGFPVGRGEYRSPGSFHYGQTDAKCEFFFAKVGWVDETNKVTYFANTDGKEIQKDFAVCQPSEIPAAVSAPPPPPSGAAAVGPGLYVSSVRVSPEKPARNQDVTFFVTFSNTTNTVQNFTWRVYIYKSDALDRSNSETTFTGTSFPVGSGEYKSLGAFRYGPSGSQCDDFIARVGWADQNNKVTFFADSNGKVVEKPFSVCN